ncbi:hypothetical protein AVEN_71494-1 [Araneus ventricosus]|uniref:Uncharacterized protein n=1 Tax=Araneus ventricosus TaxID=182803 RepID=A0A4Y2FDN4_ARAVE|nr:hypothetical protein AVEN_71494-1 [Araneus ventricosus]
MIPVFHIYQKYSIVRNQRPGDKVKARLLDNKITNLIKQQLNENPKSNHKIIKHASYEMVQKEEENEQKQSVFKYSNRLLAIGRWVTSQRGRVRSASQNSPLKLVIHHRSVPIHLADSFHFQPIKFRGSFTGRTVPTGATCNPISQATAPPPPLAFKTGPFRPDLSRLTPTHPPPPSFCGFRFCERSSVRLTDYHVSVPWPSGPNENPNSMEF